MAGLEEAILRNVEACKKLSDITRTSLGPNGMNKMVINHLEKLFVTNDAVTIMSQMEVAHPAAKLLVLASQMQEREVGDGSNFVIVFAGELLSQAEDLLRMGLHPSEVIRGYKTSLKISMEYMQQLVIWKLNEKDLYSQVAIAKAIHACVGSKQLANVELLAPLIADACITVMPTNPANFIVDNVRVCKCLGGDLSTSEVIKGMVIKKDCQTTIKEVIDAKVAVFTCSLDASQTDTKGNILINNADELLNYNKSEEEQLEKSIKAVVDSGANVVIAGGPIGDMALHFLDKYKLLAIRIQSKFELRRLTRAIKARPQVAVGKIRPEDLGYCAKVHVREVGLQKLTVFAQGEKRDATDVATVLLRSSTRQILMDIERAIDDGVNVVKAMCKDPSFMVGAGANDIALAREVMSHAERERGLQQYAMKRFSRALEVVPRTLAENAGIKAEEAIAALYSAQEQKKSTGFGINIDAKSAAESAVDLSATKVLDLLPTKKMAMELAVDAAITVLKVDQIIMAKPAGGPKTGGRKGHWDDDD